jgi:glyoxylase-like metal-dependent hydrolase (beta-lactamase superfamily II)
MHAHLDHVGSLDAVREKLPGVQLIVSCRESRFYEGDFSLDANEATSRIRRSSFSALQSESGLIRATLPARSLVFTLGTLR